MIRSRFEACQILGVGPFASNDEIKTAYKEQVKYLHPDSGNNSDVARYQMIVEAYDFLCKDISNYSTAKVIGNNNPRRQQREEQEAYERWYKRRKEEKAKEFERRVAECKAEADRAMKQEEEYKKAMEAINAIIMAEALKALIHEND